MMIDINAFPNASKNDNLPMTVQGNGRHGPSLMQYAPIRALGILVLALFLSSCGYEMLQYDQNVNARISLVTKTSASEFMHQELIKLGSKYNMKHKIKYTSQLFPDRPSIHIYSKYMYISCALSELNLLNINFHKSRIPGRELDAQTVTAMVQDFTQTLIAIEGVSLDAVKITSTTG